jgi:DNA-binding transcriptional ArsR family regulator
MGIQHERFATWLQSRRGPREPKLEALLLRVADAYDTVKEREELLADQLRLIVEAASSSRALLWTNCVSFLGVLSQQWPQAAEAVLAMSRNRIATVRFNAICCLTAGTPEAVITAVLKAGLVDKSSRVRWKATDVLEKLEKRSLIPELTSALAAEQNAKTRRALEHHLLLLRDGYIVEQESDSTFQVCARTRGGCAARGVTEAELRAKGIDRIVSEIQKRSNRYSGSG